MKNTFRVLFRDKIYSCINIFGLAIGLVSGIFILLYVTDEWSYDRYHKDANRIYRVIADFTQEGKQLSTSTTTASLARVLQRELSEVECVTRVFPTNHRKTIFHFGISAFYEDKMYDADSSIFQVFSFPFVKGDAKSALKNPESLVFTESTARKYFGDQDPIGKIVTVEDQYLGTRDLIVTAVLKDIPLNSHFRFDILRPARYMITQNIDEGWGFPVFHTYIKLKKFARPERVNERLDQTVKRHNPENKNHYYIQPLLGIHLHSHLLNEIEPNGSSQTLIVLITLGFFIIGLAVINYVNLATARAINRAKEVGVRKVTGALKSSLIVQFLVESLVMTLIAMFIAILAVILMLPYFNDFTGKHFTITLNGHFSLWALIFVFTLLIGLLSGIYPAFHLSSFSPVRGLLKKQNETNSAWSLKNVLVSVQFIASISLIICTVVMVRQLDFIQSSRLGFDREQVIVIPDVNRSFNRVTFCQRLLQHHEIVHVGASSGMLSGNNWRGKVVSHDFNNSVPVTMCNIDTGLLKTLNIEVVALKKISLYDSLAGIILNETAARQLGYSPPYEEEILWTENHHPLKTIGVVKDFHFESLHERIGPFVFQVLDQFLSNLFIRIKPLETKNALALIEAEWKNVAPDKPFQFFFLDNHIEKLYQKEMKFRTFLLLISTVAIVIASLGLLGLAAFIVKSKTKEIGIRKVLGASILSLLATLTGKILIVISVSIVIALPLAYGIMENWLNGFAYHIAIRAHAELFFLPSVLVAILSLAAVSLSMLKTMLENPVNALRNE